MLIMLFMSFLSLAFNIHPVKGSGIIYIKADGSIDPPTAPIQRNGNLYSLTGNINDSIIIQKNNIIVDGKGYTLHGTGSGTGFLISERNNVTVRNAYIENFEYGILVQASSCNNRIYGNNITSSSTAGIRVALLSVNNSIYRNKITIDTYEGVEVDTSSNNNEIYENNVIAASFAGIRIYSSSYNNISRNNVTANIVSIAVWYSSTYNNVYENNISGNNSYGIFLYLSSVDNNIFGNNVIANSQNGIRLESSSGNNIFHNNFIDNAHQVDSFNSTNIWDDGYPSGGNYWSDYTGIDEKNGPSQDLSGSDGIGDSEYVIDVNNSDNYPLMRPFSSYPHGPRMDNLSIKYYPNGTEAYNALMNGEADLINEELSWGQADEVFNDANVQAAISPATDIFMFDINNNATIPTYRDWTSPTAYRGFRQGIACLVNKTQIVNDICNYSYRIDTPIPRPNGDWWVEWAVSQYDPYGSFLGNYPYEYNSTLATNYFDDAGFIQGETTNPYYNSSFPGSAQYLRIHPETGEDLAPLIFYIRNDSPITGRLQAGRILRDNLRKMGIPVNAIEASVTVCIDKVMRKGDYHIYTGGWSLSFAQESLTIYKSANAGGSMMINYGQFRNATYDAQVGILESSLSLDIAREAAFNCQRILIEEAATIWLFSRSAITGYRNIYGVVNSRGDRIDNEWTFLTARLNGTRTNIQYGLRNPPISLNIIKDYGIPGAITTRTPVSDCLDCIYDTLLSYSPYDKSPGIYYGEAMPWIAMDWEVSEWQSPYNPAQNLTKLTFFLRNGVKWHDGFELTSADVKFTIDYLKGLGSTTMMQWAVVDVHHVTTPSANVVVVYENISSPWTLNNIGRLPILPKHIFQNIGNVDGYTPGASEGHPANETLIGSGPWRYVFHNSSMLYLEANRDYFMETPPEAEVDFGYDWELGCWTVDNMDATMVAEAFATQGDGVPPAKWEPGCDIAKGDCKVNAFDLIKVAQLFNSSWGWSRRRYVPAFPTECSIYIQQNSPILVGQNLTAYVKMENVSRLSGVQFKLNYDNSKLDCLNLDVNPIFGEDTIETKKVANQTAGYVWVSISSKGAPISGNVTLARIVFNTTRPSGSILDLWNTKLLGYGNPGETCKMLIHATVDTGVLVGVSTPMGMGVTVAPAENTRVTFTETTSTGITTLDMKPPPSEGFTSVVCQEIKTTASYTGNVNIQFAYDPTGLSLEDELAMKIWLWNESSQSWIDITSFVDTVNNVIHGVSPHLSIFGVTDSLSVIGDVITAGKITAKIPDAPPDPPPGLICLDYYDIQSTIVFSGPVTIRAAYDDTDIQPEQEILTKIWLWNESSHKWVDITVRIDTEKNLVYGVSQHLSIFGVTSFLRLPAGIVIFNETCPKWSIGQEYNMTISFTVENLGDFTRSFNVIVYRNATVLASYAVHDLDPNEKITLAYEWNTLGWPKGRYAISAGNKLNRWVSVTLPGDVDGDFDVDIYDVVKICTCYGSKKGEQQYYPNCDIDDNEKINIFDVVIATSRYGMKDP
jgi:parallel beta-helix repeat protein